MIVISSPASQRGVGGSRYPCQIALNVKSDVFERELDVFHRFNLWAQMAVAVFRPAVIEPDSPTS
jgi:hypothetical protein